MAERRHSAVFDFLIEVTTDVAAATFPAHPTTGKMPWLDGKGLPTETFDEFVTVRQVIEDGAGEWARLSPAGRDETMVAEIVVDTSVPGRSALEVLARLSELSEVVAGLYYDPTTYVFTPPAVDGAVALGGIKEPPRVEVWPTDRGHAGRSSIRYEFRSQI